MPYRPAQFAARGFCLPFAAALVAGRGQRGITGITTCRSACPCPLAAAARQASCCAIMRHLQGPPVCVTSRSFFKICRVWVQGHPFGAGALPRALPAPCLCAAARRGRPFCAGGDTKHPVCTKAFVFLWKYPPFSLVTRVETRKEHPSYENPPIASHHTAARPCRHNPCRWP